MSGIIIKPLVTEKISRLTDRSKNKQYAFLVALDANKIEIKKALETKFGVEIASLRTSITPRRTRRRYGKAGVTTGYSNKNKKAFITLAQGKEIDFYSNT